jgi:hypothetical protein
VVSFARSGDTCLCNSQFVRREGFDLTPVLSSPISAVFADNADSFAVVIVRRKSLIIDAGLPHL